MATTESGLECSRGYLDAIIEERAAICNGCGASNSKFDFVPDTIYGMDIQWACWIHDWDYHFGSTWDDKRHADERFLSNLLRLIERDTKWWRYLMKPLMRRRALKYYEAVVRFGGDAFWYGKERFPGKGKN